MKWEISVSIFRNSTIMQQLAIAIGIPFGILILFLFFSSSGENLIYVFYVLGLIVALFLFTYLLIMVVYGGKYEVGFEINRKGIFCYTQPQQARKNRIINGLVVVLGLLSGKPAVAGAGVLANTRQSTFLTWNRVRKVKYVPKQRLVILRGTWTEKMAVFCTEENYHDVEGAIRGNIKS